MDSFSVDMTCISMENNIFLCYCMIIVAALMILDSKTISKKCKFKMAEQSLILKQQISYLKD